MGVHEVKYGQGSEDQCTKRWVGEGQLNVSGLKPVVVQGGVIQNGSSACAVDFHVNVKILHRGLKPGDNPPGSETKQRQNC